MSGSERRDDGKLEAPPECARCGKLAFSATEIWNTGGGYVYLVTELPRETEAYDKAADALKAAGVKQEYVCTPCFRQWLEEFYGAMRLFLSMQGLLSKN